MRHAQATPHIATPVLAWLVVPVLLAASAMSGIVLGWQTRLTGDPRPLVLGVLVGAPPLFFLALAVWRGRMVHRGGSP